MIQAEKEATEEDYVLGSQENVRPLIRVIFLSFDLGDFLSERIFIYVGLQLSLTRHYTSQVPSVAI